MFSAYTLAEPPGMQPICRGLVICYLWTMFQAQTRKQLLGSVCVAGVVFAARECKVISLYSMRIPGDMVYIVKLYIVDT